MLSKSAVKQFEILVLSIDLCWLFLNATKGVPPDSVLGFTIFTIYINDVGQNMNASVHLYANDVVYCCASTVALAFEHLQSAFDTIQLHLFRLRQVLNAETKVMFFTRCHLFFLASCLHKVLVSSLWPPANI